jgi:DNA-binding NarL/FixJ family response regulator
MERRTSHPTSLLFIDGNAADRTFYVEGLKRCSPDYVIREAIDGESGLHLYRSHRIDCVILSHELPDCSGFRVLVDLIPIASRPSIAVLMLTNSMQRGLNQIAMQNGAYACFVKQFTLFEDIDRAIQRAMAIVGRLHKEDRNRPKPQSLF